MDYHELRAAPPLDRLVRCFWFLRTDGPSAAQPVVPDGRAEIILHLANPFSLVEGATASRQAEAMISGQLSAPIQLVSTGAADVIGVRFRTAAAGPALRLALDRFENAVVPLCDYSPRLAEELLSAASRHATPAARAASLSRVLLRRLSPDIDPLAWESVRLLDRARSPAPVRQLARDAGVSARTLERRVGASVGLSPKMLHRVLRFRKVSSHGDWARAAAEAGYYDQSHLIRDFRRFTGSPPGAFVASAPELAMSLLSNTGGPEMRT